MLNFTKSNVSKEILTKVLIFFWYVDRYWLLIQEKCRFWPTKLLWVLNLDFKFRKDGSKTPSRRGFFSIAANPFGPALARWARALRLKPWDTSSNPTGVVVLILRKESKKATQNRSKSHML